MNCNNTKTRSRNRYHAPTISNIVNEIFNAPITQTVEKVAKHTRPAVNVEKNENEYKLHLAIPGFQKKDFTIDIEQRKLTISTNADENKERKYRLREFNYGQVKRAFNIPTNVDTKAITASYDLGVLSLTLPVAEDSKPKSIKIK